MGFLYIYLAMYILVIEVAIITPPDPKFGRMGNVLLALLYGLVWPVILIASIIAWIVITKNEYLERKMNSKQA